jgi:hypothetical protein
MKVGEWVVVLPRTDVDSRKSDADQVPYTPTPKQMLYGTRAEIRDIQVERNSAGHALRGTVTLRMIDSHGSAKRGYMFGGFSRPFEDGRLYTIDRNPNDIYGSFLAAITEGLRAGGPNGLYRRLTDSNSITVNWPDPAAVAQRCFLDGLEALQEIGAMNSFESGKRDYISLYGDAPTLLVQGPPRHRQDLLHGVCRSRAPPGGHGSGDSFPSLSHVPYPRRHRRSRVQAGRGA